MFTNKVEVLNMARAMSVHAAARQTVIAGNIANADTPGYLAREVPAFADIWSASSGQMRHSRPGHSGSGGQQDLRPAELTRHISPNGNSVSLETEMMKAVETRQAHDLALAIYRSLSGAIRTSLGRK